MGSGADGQTVDARTRVSAVVSSVKPPDDSSFVPGARESQRCTAICIWHTGTLLSSTSSTSSASTSWSCSSESTSASGTSGAPAPTARSAARTPAAGTSLSFINAASPSPSGGCRRRMAAHARHARDGAPGDGLAVDTHGAIIGGVACTVAFALMVRPKRGAEALASSQLEPAA